MDQPSSHICNEKHLSTKKKLQNKSLMDSCLKMKIKTAIHFSTLILTLTFSYFTVKIKPWYVYKVEVEELKWLKLK